MFPKFPFPPLMDIYTWQLVLRALYDYIIWGMKIFKTGALEDTSRISPYWIEWDTWEPSMYITPFSENHLTSMDWSDLTIPCIRLEMAAPGEIGSLTIYWRSWDETGITNPPPESIAAVDPAAVETLIPLDRQFANRVHDSPSLWILTRSTTREWPGLPKW